MSKPQSLTKYRMSAMATDTHERVKAPPLCATPSLLVGLSMTLVLTFLWSPITRAADPAKGSAVYHSQCESCHGTRGEGVMPGTPDLVRGNALLQPDGGLLEMIKAGRNAMPSYNGLLSDMDILDVIAYMRTL